MALLGPAKARCFAGSGVLPARVGPELAERWLPSWLRHNQLVFRL